MTRRVTTDDDVITVTSQPRTVRWRHQVRTTNRYNYILHCIIFIHRLKKFTTVLYDIQGRSQEFATGVTKEGVLGTEVPSGVHGKSHSEGLGAKPHKPETNANFQLRRGACTHIPPWLHH